MELDEYLINARIWLHARTHPPTHTHTHTNMQRGNIRILTNRRKTITKENP